MTYISQKSRGRNIADSLMKEYGHVSVEKLKIRCALAQPNPVAWKWVVHEYLEAQVFAGILVFDTELNAFVVKENKKQELNVSMEGE